MPRVSIFIPVFNAEKYLEATIGSVLAQTFKDWELLIIDDASTDGSYEIAKAHENQDARIKSMKNEANLGMLKNWNKGIGLCHSEYFVKLDADDIWHPDILAKSVDILNKFSDVGMVFSKYLNIDEHGNTIPNSASVSPDFARGKSFSCIPLVKSGSDKMLGHNILRQGISLVRRKVFDEIGDYWFLKTPETQASTDTEFYFRLGLHYKIYGIDEVLYHYRIHPASISASNAKLGLQAQKMVEVKLAILKYYLAQKAIDRAFYNEQKKAALFAYYKKMLYSSRLAGNYAGMVYWLAANFIINPKKTLSYYFNRGFAKK